MNVSTYVVIINVYYNPNLPFPSHSSLVYEKIEGVTVENVLLNEKC